MRIVIVTSMYPPAVGGPSEQSRQLARELTAKGHEVFVLVVRDSPGMDDFHSEAYEARQVAVGRGIIPGGPLGRRRSLYQLLKAEFMRFSPDLIHVQVFAGPSALICAVLAAKMGVASVVKITGERTYEGLLEKGVKEGSFRYFLTEKISLASDRAVLKRFTRVWCTTEHFRERMIQSYGVEPQKVFVVPNFQDISPYETLGEERLRRRPRKIERLLTVARLRPWKGIEICLKALSRLEGVTWTFVGTGKDQYVASLKALSAELGVESRVNWLGDLCSALMPECYAKHDMVVLASDREPFGIVLVEAMASQMPVVATRVDGIPSVLEGYSRYELVERGDAEELFRAIEGMRTRQVSMVQPCLDCNFRRFSVSGGAEALTEQYRQVVS